MSIYSLVGIVGHLGVELWRRRRRRCLEMLLLAKGVGWELGAVLGLRLTLRVGLGVDVEVGLSLQLWPGGGFGFPFGGVVKDVQTPAAGGNDIGDKFGAFGADVAQRAAVSVQVGKLLLH